MVAAGCIGCGAAGGGYSSRCVARKTRWWFWLLPVGIAGSAFTIDFWVQTDAETIRSVIAQAVEAVEDEDVNGISPLISSDYHDSIHDSKESLLGYCRLSLSDPLIEKNVHRVVSLDIKTPAASAVFTVRMVFDPKGPVYAYRKIMLFKVQADFQKQGPDWFCTRIEILEVDMQPADWRHIQGAGSEIF